MNRCVRYCLLAWCGFIAATISAAEPLPADLTIEQAIDRAIAAKLTAANVSPTPLASDANLLRRTMLDLVGRIPTAAEAQAYVADDSSDKRQKLVERLLASPSFPRHQANEFDTLLMFGSGQSLREYLLTSFQEKKRWDKMFREMILGQEQDAEQKGSINFVKSRLADLDKLTNDVSVLFFGVNVSCAKCHDHPLVHDWKQDHYYGMKSFFGRTYANGDFIGERNYGLVDYKTTKGESHQAPLMFLSGEKLTEPENVEPDEAAKKEEKKLLEELKKNKQPPPAPTFSRRALLVEVALKSDAAPFFSQAIVNHVWNRHFGRGLVHPVDQMHAENPASHPELLAWLAHDFVANGYDLPRLIRGIALSQAYARSSRWEGEKLPDPELFAVANVRPLSPVQYGTLLKLAVTPPEEMPSSSETEKYEKKIEQIEAGGRGLGNSFEQPGDDFQVSVDEALLFSNSERIQKELIPDQKNSLAGKMREAKDVNAAIDLACWNLFGRPATETERTAFTQFLHRREGREGEGYPQLLWALLTSGECRFNF